MNYLKDITFNLPAAMYILLGKTLSKILLTYCETRVHIIDISLIVINLFPNVNDYVSQKKAKPRLSAKELQELIECLLGNLTNPWLCKSDFLNFHHHLIKLVDACKATVIHVDTKIASSTSRNVLTELARTPESHSLITKIYPTSTVKQNYQKLDQDIWILFGNCL